MKYLQDGGFQNHPLMRLTLGFCLLFLTGLWITHALLYFSKMGISADSVVRYYLGSDSDFRMPRTYLSMLEVTHMHLPMMALVLLLLTHLLIFAPFAHEAKASFIALSFLSGFLNEASGWLVRFVSPLFAYLKIASFLVFQSALLMLIVSLAWFLLGSHKHSKRGAQT